MKNFNYKTASKKELIEEIIIELSGFTSWVLDCRKNVKKTEIDKEQKERIIGHLLMARFYAGVLTDTDEERKQYGLEPWKQ